MNLWIEDDHKGLLSFLSDREKWRTGVPVRSPPRYFFGGSCSDRRRILHEATTPFFTGRVYYICWKIFFLLRHTSFPYFFFFLLLLLFFRSSKKEKGSDYIGILKIQSPPGLMCSPTFEFNSRFPILSFIHSFLFLFSTFFFIFHFQLLFFSLLLESVLRHAITNKTYTTRPCEDPSMKRD